ncbi:MAG: peptide MFS transporter [Steroidobacteraceae bacterium]
MSSASARYSAGNWRGFPKGAWLIVGVEFWEHFSLYGMLAILALFLTGNPTRGGFGWSDGNALTLVGIYSGALYAFPALGGYFADRILGRRRAVTIGAALMLVGQVLMVSPVFIPSFLGAWHGASLLHALHELNVPLGYIVRPQAVSAAIAARGALLDSERGADWLSLAYLGSAFGLYTAIGCLVLGNALLKPAMVVLCGDTFEAGNTRRQGAYAYFYFAIALSGLLAGVVVGSVAASFGWHYGFTVAAVGMAIGLGMYWVLGPRLLGDLGMTRDGPRAAGGDGAAPSAALDEPTNESRQTGTRLLLLAVLALLLCVFCAGWSQMFGTWSLFIERSVDRSIDAFVVPVPWFVSWNSLVVIAFAPAVTALWARLGASKQAVDIVQKYAFALATVAAGHFLMYWGAARALTGEATPVWVPMLALALTAVGELVAWASTYDMVYRVAPPGFGSVTMGAWYLMTLGLGGYLSGVPGTWVEVLGYGRTFLLLGLLMTAGMIAALLMRGYLRGLATRVGITL